MWFISHIANCCRTRQKVGATISLVWNRWTRGGLCLPWVGVELTYISVIWPQWGHPAEFCSCSWNSLGLGIDGVEKIWAIAPCAFGFGLTPKIHYLATLVCLTKCVSRRCVVMLAASWDDDVWSARRGLCWVSASTCSVLHSWDVSCARKIICHNTTIWSVVQRVLVHVVVLHSAVCLKLRSWPQLVKLSNLQSFCLSF